MSKIDLKKLPLDTSLRDALRLAIQQGSWVFGTETSEPMPGPHPSRNELEAWSERRRSSMTTQEIDEEIKSVLDDCCNIESLADLKRDIMTGNYGWRNSESGMIIRNLGIMFGMLSLE